MHTLPCVVARPSTHLVHPSKLFDTSLHAPPHLSTPFDTSLDALRRPSSRVLYAPSISSTRRCTPLHASPHLSTHRCIVFDALRHWHVIGRPSMPLFTRLVCPSKRFDTSLHVPPRPSTPFESRHVVARTSTPFDALRRVIGRLFDAPRHPSDVSLCALPSVALGCESCDTSPLTAPASVRGRRRLRHLTFGVRVKPPRACVWGEGKGALSGDPHVFVFGAG
jgi:hypothetical protein